MKKPICGFIAPRQEEMVGDREDGYLAECVLPKSHEFERHVVKTPDGEIFSWQHSGCDCCKPWDPDRCYEFGRMTPEVLETLIEAESRGRSAHERRIANLLGRA